MRLRATKALVVVTSRGPRAASTRNPACVASGDLEDAMQRRVKRGERRLRKAVRPVCGAFAVGSVSSAAGAAAVPSATSVVADGGMRVSSQEEMEGLDLHEHGRLAYPAGWLAASDLGSGSAQ